MGPAMMSELLSHVHPQSCLLWNRRAYVGMNYLGLAGLPKHNYQLTGSKYAALCEEGKRLAGELQRAGVANANLLDVDYFIWEELQVEDNLSHIGAKESPTQMSQEVAQEIGRAHV